MKRLPGLQFTGMAIAALFGTAFGLISPASAQTVSSGYTSTAPKDCRVTSAGTEDDDSSILADLRSAIRLLTAVAI